MTRHPDRVTLRRGVATLRSMADALDRLGIDDGDDFLVMRAADFASGLGIDEDALGPFGKGGDTSRRAAINAYPKSGTQRWQVFLEIAKAYSHRFGLTRNECSVRLGIPDSSADARVLELRQGGWIQETERTRQTENGQEARILEPTPAGWVALEDYEHIPIPPGIIDDGQEKMFG
jgi:hypothetical protein